MYYNRNTFLFCSILCAKENIFLVFLNKTKLKKIREFPELVLTPYHTVISGSEEYDLFSKLYIAFR